MTDQDKPKKTTGRKPNPVIDSASASAELAALAARRPFVDTRNVDRPATGRDHTAPGNEAEHPLYSDATATDDGDNPLPAELLAKPALDGHVELETASRTSDRKAVTDTRFHKRYVVIRAAYQPETDAIHARNKVEILNDAINHGLHPRGESTFDGVEDHPDGVSVYLDYSVEVIPASVDSDAPSTTTPLSMLRDKYDGTTESEAAADAEGFDPTR